MRGMVGSVVSDKEKNCGVARDGAVGGARWPSGQRGGLRGGGWPCHRLAQVLRREHGREFVDRPRVSWPLRVPLALFSQIMAFLPSAPCGATASRRVGLCL